LVVDDEYPVMSCCKRDNGFNRRLQASIKRKLEEVRQVFPNCSIVQILDRHGAVVSQVKARKAQKAPGDWAQLIVALKKSATQFGQSNGESV
jgi:hypothetical protein